MGFFKKNQHYLYLSIFFIILFFVGNYFISNKVNSIVEDFVDFVVKGDLRGKHNILKYNFEKLNSFTTQIDKLVDNSKDENLEKLRDKLLLKVENILSEKVIDYGYVYIVKNDSLSYAAVLEKKKTAINTKEGSIRELKNLSASDTVIKFNNTYYNRKTTTHLLENNTKVIVGYDINLIKYWKFFSEYYSGAGGYSVLTNSRGICLLHPEPNYIGKKLNYFNKISLKDILTKDLGKESNFLRLDKLYKTKTISEYLKVAVLRYFDVIEIKNNPLILITSYPIEIIIKEPIKEITKYFSLIGGGSILTFIIIFGLSRWQLRRQYFKTLKYEQERKKLAISNEQYQQKNAVLQLDQLRKKMNPHFLFNSLNSLHILIDLDKKLSQRFVLELAEVYRYLLEDRSGNLATVKEELNFLKQYLFLHKIRLNNNLQLNIVDNSDKNTLAKKIPFLSLGTLIENAIKHNKITKKRPLFIHILINNKQIEVINNYNPTKNKDIKGYQIGLSYLKNCYQFYKIDTFRAGVYEEKFKCILPLIL